MKTIIPTFCLLAISMLWMGCPNTTRQNTPEMTVMSDSIEGASVDPAFDTAQGGNLSGDFAAGGTLPARDGAFAAAGDADIQAYSSVYFDFDRAYVRESERSVVEETATFLLANPGQKVLVEGHCDWQGTAEYNLALGDHRANAVKDYLVELGVPASTIEILSKGDLEADDTADEAGRQRDRRADIIVLP